jgi:hypothetical protein
MPTGALSRHGEGQKGLSAASATADATRKWQPRQITAYRFPLGTKRGTSRHAAAAGFEGISNIFSSFRQFLYVTVSIIVIHVILSKECMVIILSPPILIRYIKPQ